MTLLSYLEVAVIMVLFLTLNTWWTCITNSMRLLLYSHHSHFRKLTKIPSYLSFSPLVFKMSVCLVSLVFSNQNSVRAHALYWLHLNFVMKSFKKENCDFSKGCT